ncbi:MAG: bis(5'-nucleosyl)-tetraphosphatase (symmetrical) YqeK [Eggerthellaceae bacterium]|nr:bis(5'-nucleosyl)-tetraphosphatase (symmetrical) YqeK [Eggerthellaceae bacterium]
MIENSEASENPFDDEHYQQMKARLKDRVKPKRFKHSKGVAKTAKRLAKVYGLDPMQARMAGLVHDWDKCYDYEGARRRALDLQLDIDPVFINEMPWLLHGPTAALALSREFPEWGSDTFQAIARHTCGAADMTPLDCVIYVADIIEPRRDYGSNSGLDDLRALVGEVPLQELYYQAFKFTFRYLLEGDRRLFPGTADIYNSLIVEHTEWANAVIW